MIGLARSVRWNQLEVLRIWWFHNAELLHGTQPVALGPSLDDLAVFDPVDMDPLDHNLLSRRWNSIELAFVGASGQVSSDHHVAFSDQVLDDAFGVWKRFS